MESKTSSQPLHVGAHVHAEQYRPKPLTKAQTIALSIKLILGASAFGGLLWVIEAAVN